MPQLSRSVRGLAALRTAVLRVQMLEEQLERAEAEVKRLQEVELPSAFSEDQISELRLPNLPMAKRHVDIQGSLPSETERPVERENALTWLIENGYGDTIRSTVSAAFSQGDHEAALELFTQLRRLNNATVKKKEDVHHSTLRAIVRQRLEANQETPVEELGCTIIRRIRFSTPPRPPADDDVLNNSLTDETQTNEGSTNA